MFAAIIIPDFALQAVLRREPELHPRAVGLIEEEALPHGAKENGYFASESGVRNDDDQGARRAAKATLFQITAAARSTGIVTGMTTSQAQARCGDLLIRHRSPEAERSAQAALLEAAFTLSSFVEETAPGVCTVELIPSAASTSPEDALPPPGWRRLPACDLRQPAEDTPRAASRRPQDEKAREESRSVPSLPSAAPLLAHLGALHLHARIGIAPNADLARLAAESAAPVREIQHASQLHDLPLEQLSAPLAILEILHRWGVRSLGGFVALGREALVARLGPEVLPLFDRAAGRTTRPLRCVQPAEIFEESIEFEHEIETLEPLLFILRRLLEAITLRLEAVYRVAAELTLRLGLSDGGEHERVFKIPSPTHHVDVLFRMLHTHLEGFTTEHPIVALKLIAQPARAARQQFGLFESALRDPNQFAETLARLVALLGHERVGTPELEPTHRPDAFRLRPADFTSGARAASAAALPLGLTLRRFRPPQVAEVELGEGPRHVRAAGASGEVTAAYGPMVLSGDWWAPQAWSRREWDVQLTGGRLCRIYEQANAWFLEGVYD